MPGFSRSPSPAEVINDAVANGLAEVRVGMPGQIQAYYPATQTADVLPLPKPRLVLEDGTETVEPYPVLAHVPVHFPSGGGYRLTFPVAAGDECWLSFADHSIDIWQAQGGQYAPIDLREHHVSDAICIPGVKSDTKAWKDASTTEATFGKDGGLTIRVGENTIDLGGGSSDFVAMAALVHSQLQNIASKFDAHKHSGVQTGGGTSGAPQVTDQIGTTGSVASTTIKVKG